MRLFGGGAGAKQAVSHSITAEANGIDCTIMVRTANFGTSLVNKTRAVDANMSEADRDATVSAAAAAFGCAARSALASLLRSTSPVVCERDTLNLGFGNQALSKYAYDLTTLLAQLLLSLHP